MALSWNEIKDRALNFSKEWADTSNEEADAKPFLVEFFNVFGISSKRVSTFEHRVKKLDDKDGYIDLLWKGTILIEMKSRGKNLDKAYQQAKDYLHGLKQHELPKYILISDFENFRLYDIEEDKIVEFKLNNLIHNVQHFGYILGYQKKVYKEQDPANIKAAELMGKLHDRLEEIGYTGHPLEVYLVRILFLLFAEDTTIFNKQQFQDYLEQRTNEDGSDLIEGKDNILLKRTSPICKSPIMTYGSMPNEGGYLLMNEDEKADLINKEPDSKKYIRQFVMGEELINSIPRYCLWLEDIQPDELNKLKEVSKRVKAVFEVRNFSNREATKKLSQYPTRFGEMRQPLCDYIALPRVSSENRKFIPVTILKKEVIAGDKVYTISSDSKYIFGIIISTMHMSWMRVTSGRLKSDYSYSTQLTYNNFPWPENPTEKQIKAIEIVAQNVLEVRSAFPKSTLADLYRTTSMPPALVKAHNDLDKAVDLAYRAQAFTSEANRMVFLFELYEKYTADLFSKAKPKKPKNKA